MIGDKIRKTREAKGFSQEYVADKLGISQPAYNKVESGSTRPNPKRIAQLAEILDTDPEEWLQGEEGYSITINHNRNDKDGTFYSVQVMEYNHELTLELIKAKDSEIHTLKEVLQDYRALIHKLTNDPPKGQE